MRSDHFLTVTEASAHEKWFHGTEGYGLRWDYLSKGCEFLSQKREVFAEKRRELYVLSAILCEHFPPRW
jgi:hypothetical protein